MERILVGILLALIPVINFCLAYHFSRQEGKLHRFRNHFTFYYADWLFVLFNFLFVFAVRGDYYWAFVLALFSIVCAFIMNIIWFAHHRKTKNEGHMYNFKTRRLTRAGLTHAIYLPIQLFLIIYFVFFSINNIFSFANLVILLPYFLSYPLTSKRMHGRFIFTDLFAFVLGLGVLLIKFLTYFGVF